MDNYTQWTLQDIEVTDEQIQAAQLQVACMEQREAENNILWEDDNV